MMTKFQTDEQAIDWLGRHTEPFARKAVEHARRRTPPRVTEALNEYLLEAAQLAPVEFMSQLRGAIEKIEPKTWNVDCHDRGDGRITHAVIRLKPRVSP